MRFDSITLIALLLSLPSCRSVPKATKEEIAIRDQWAARVSPTARDKVFAEADRHAEWGEKMKIRFEVERFQKYLRDHGKKD